MSLHLNLRHELVAQRLQRQRDPLKLAMYGLAAIGAGLLGYYFFRVQEVRLLAAKNDRLNEDWQRAEPTFNAAKAREAEITALMTNRDKLVKWIENRNYWAPVLGKILEVVPREVQITRIDGDLAEPPRKVGITLNGISAGSEPRTIAEDLRRQLLEKMNAGGKKTTSSFKSLDEGTDMAKLDSATLPTAKFTIRLETTDPATEVVAEKPRAPRRPR
jgi:Tfp pilus assembly protein PilN